jgi:hypothetical protein
VTNPVVALDYDTVRRIGEVMPRPVAGPIISPRAMHALEGLDDHLEALRAQLDLVSHRPLQLAARELLRRGRFAASEGWLDDAERDLREALVRDPYHPASHLLLAHVLLSTDRQNDGAVDALRRAVRYGARLDQEVGARAVLDLADELRRRGADQEAADHLVAASSVIDSVPVALSAARATGDAAWEERLSERAPRYVAQWTDGGAHANPRTYGAATETLLAAAAAADVELDRALLPEPDDPLDEARTAAVVDHARERERARWSVPLDVVSARLSVARVARDQAAEELVRHRSKPAAVKHVYASRTAELEQELSAVEAHLREIEAHPESLMLEPRQELARVLGRFDLSEVSPDDLGVVPVPPGLRGAIDGAK